MIEIVVFLKLVLSLVLVFVCFEKMAQLANACFVLISHIVFEFKGDILLFYLFTNENIIVF